MDHVKSNVTFHPLISSMQKIALYETKSHFHLIGSNNTLTHFRVLKIDRLVPRDLIIQDDKKEYTQNEIKNLVKDIDDGNKSHTNQRSSVSGVTKVVSAFGIIGFIRFLEGHYVILITKRRKVATIGHHTIYKIEDTTMIYIPSDSIRIFHPDEQRYVKMFQSIDLSSNFYFSYSYDLTHTLQNNMTLPKRLKAGITKTNFSPIFSDDLNEPKNFDTMWSFLQDASRNAKKPIVYGIRNNPHTRFVWNEYLLSGIKTNLHNDWILYIIHGFVGQSNISVFGRSLYITLIARRSSRYAGTRFLKRGANFMGDVANEVETEQIVQDIGVGLLNKGRFSSFVQMRGSVPGNWSQDISKMVPKPTITVDLSDPFVEIAGTHFNDLFKRYGAPITILNLVKKREKRRHESILSEELNLAVRYLNQFLPLEYNIQYIAFDMARKNKGKEANVMERLANIANNAVMKTGIFLALDSSFHTQEFIRERIIKNKDAASDKIKVLNKERLQTGVIRTNCVDCLDRTNTAQFVIGKCALGYQLHALSILNSPKLEFDSDCVRMLEELYEDHGDTLALQYGGSQLVHRIKTYRKTAPWTSQGNDIMQTLSRYYSNTFSDQEKQHTINIFLGSFVPEEGRPPIWEYFTDYYFHHEPACKYSKQFRILTQWCNENSIKCFPFASLEVGKTCAEIVQVQSTLEEKIDIYHDYYKPYELSLLSEIYAYQISHSVRDFMPNFTTDFSPFSVRVRPGKRREEAGNKLATMKNPSLTGQSSTSSTASSTNSSSSSSDEDDNQYAVDSQMTTSKNSAEVSFEILFPSMKNSYGIEPVCPKRSNVHLYKKFVSINKSVTFEASHLKRQYKPTALTTFSNTSFFDVKQQTKNDHTCTYKQFVARCKLGGFMPIPSDMYFYERYAHQQQLQLGIIHPDLL